VVVLALAVWGYGIACILDARPVTLARAVTWRDDRGALIPTNDPRGRTPCSWMSGHLMFAVSDRVIVQCTHVHSGWAEISPREGTATFRWPLPADVHDPRVLGLAPREDGRFGIVFDAEASGVDRLMIALAGPRGWLVPPTVIGNQDNGNDWSELLGMAWVGDAVEAVVTTPVPGFSNDPFGMRSAPTIVRASPGAPIATTPHPFPPCAPCALEGALPDPKGWKLVISGYDEVRREPRVQLISSTGEPLDAPPELGWWKDRLRADRAALGVLDGWSSRGIVERDGSLRPSLREEQTPMVDRGLSLVDGVLRQVPMWLDADNRVFAIVAGKTVALARDRSDRLTIDGVAVIADPGGQPAMFLPVEDRIYWVSQDGQYAVLDRALRRVDPLTLAEHLRTRGSTSPSIDEPEHLVPLWVLLAGLPIALVLGWIVHNARARRATRVPLALAGRRPWVAVPEIAIACGVYVLAAWWGLSHLLPML
jgi:hypothetical protein